MNQAAQKVWTRDDVVQLLQVNDRAVVRALKTLAARQTTEEVREKRTKEHNGRGFNARDAGLLTDIAQKLPRYNDNLTPRQLDLVRGRIVKYAGQLLDEIEAKGGLVCRKAQAAPAEKSVTREQVTDEPPVEETAPAIPTPSTGAPWGAWA